MSAEGERWEKAWTDEFTQGKRLYEVWGAGRLVASRLYEADADAIVAAHNAAPGGRERELREALEAAERLALGVWEACANGVTVDFYDEAKAVAEQARAALLDAAPAPAQTLDSGLAELAREMRKAAHDVMVTPSFLNAWCDRYDALVAQAETS